MAEQRHRYRKPLELPPNDGPPDHTHEQPRGLLLLIKVLTAVVVLLSITSGWLLFTTYMLQRGQSETTEYLQGRGSLRDAENERLNQRIDRAVCDVLDRLPAGELFDPARAEYGCGPGIPLDQLDPGASQNLADILGSADGSEPAQPTGTIPEPSVPTSAPDEMPPGAPPGARPSPMGQAPTSTAAPTTAPATTAPTTAASTTPPLVDLTPLTDPVCTLLGVCVGP